MDSQILLPPSTTSSSPSAGAAPSAARWSRSLPFRHPTSGTVETGKDSRRSPMDVFLRGIHGRYRADKTQSGETQPGQNCLIQPRFARAPHCHHDAFHVVSGVHSGRPSHAETTTDHALHSSNSCEKCPTVILSPSDLQGSHAAAGQDGWKARQGSACVLRRYLVQHCTLHQIPTPPRKRARPTRALLDSRAPVDDGR